MTLATILSFIQDFGLPALQTLLERKAAAGAEKIDDEDIEEERDKLKPKFPKNLYEVEE